MLARALSAVGRTLIGAGVLVLLFVAFQLWGTGLHEARAQDALGAEFTERLASVPDVAKTASELTSKDTPTTTETAAPTTTVAVPPATTTPRTATDPDRTSRAEVKPGDALARIRIAKIGVDKIVVEGVSVDDLRKGPGHYRGTPQPGDAGNAAIAGHRTTYGAPFAEIDRLTPGDQILVTTLHGAWTYEVIGSPDDPTSGHFIVTPEDVWVLRDFGDNRLTLTACHPKFSASQRIVVVATLVDAPAPTTATAPPAGAANGESSAAAGSGAMKPSAAVEPTSVDAAGAAAAPGDRSLDEGLDGDPSARNPTLLWSLVFVTLLAGVCQLARGWRRIPAYAVGAVPMVIVVFSWFEQIDRWMPAR